MLQLNRYALPILIGKTRSDDNYSLSLGEQQQRQI